MRGQLVWLGPAGAPVDFPPPDQALNWPNGLLAAGGDLAPGRLLEAYRRGIFPWYEEGQPILWWSPDPRAVMLPGDLHLSRRMRRVMRSGRFSASLDRDFAGVLAGCARRHAPTVGTWITREMAEAYTRLHQLGHAHSVEIYREERLAGGLYGLAVGRAFFAESMFSLVSDASKAALAHLWAVLEAEGFAFMDCQLQTPHLASLGARELPRREFLALVKRATADSGRAPALWTSPPGPVRWPGSPPGDARN
ncbi:MAG: leucyl/phenylalanyl-tRNA--protein transferase [Gammaproteobacteria bacterium]